MTIYRIELVRSPGLTEDERRRRLKQAFDVLLNFEIKETAGGDSTAEESAAAIAPDPKGRDARGIVADE